MHLCEPLPGIAVAYNVIDACGITLPSWFRTDSLFINFCSEGCCEINYGAAGSIMLGPNSTSISKLPMQSYIFPSGHYIGSELLFNPSSMSTDLKTLLDETMRSFPNASSHDRSETFVYAFSGDSGLQEHFKLLAPRKTIGRIDQRVACDAVKNLLLYCA